MSILIISIEILIIIIIVVLYFKLYILKIGKTFFHVSRKNIKNKSLYHSLLKLYVYMKSVLTSLYKKKKFNYLRLNHLQHSILNYQ